MRYLRRALVAVLLLAAVILTACGSSATNADNPVKSSGVLRVGTEGVYSPFSYHDPATGELVGYDVDVATPSARSSASRSNSSRRRGIPSSPPRGRPLRHRRQPGDDQRRTQGQVRPVPALHRRRGRHRHPRRRQLDQVARRPQGQDRRARTPPATGRRSPARRGPASRRSRASPRPSRC